MTMIEVSSVTFVFFAVAGVISGDTDRLFDCYAGTVQQGFIVTLESTVSPASGLAYPAGRVYLYRTP